MLITETGVPQRFITTDAWGGEVMHRLDDGWCAALDRDSMRCTIYEVRPLICREFEMGSSFQFEDRIGAGLRFSGQEIGIRALHYSNAGIKQPNDGVEAYTLHYRTSF